MMSANIIDDLFRYGAWANERILALCGGLMDSQLDERHEMGLGTLRNTLVHILAAEQAWLERWTAMPWRTFPIEAEGLPLDEIARRLKLVANRLSGFVRHPRQRLDELF